MEKETAKQKTLRAEAKARLCAAATRESSNRIADGLQVELDMQNEELRRAYAALEKSHGRYLDLYDFSPLGYLSLTRQGLIAEINLTAAALLGADRNTLLNRPFAAFVSGHDGDRWHLFFTGVISHNQRPANPELMMKRHDGSEFFAQINYLPVEDEAQGLQLRIAITEITALVNAETALRERDAFKQAILNAMSSSVAVLDSNGIIVATNQSWRAFALENGMASGLPVRNAHVGGNYLEACQTAPVGGKPDEGREAYQGIMAVLQGRLPGFTLEYPCHSPSRQHWFIMTVTPLGIDQGGVVIVHTDITERNHLESLQRIAAIAFESQEGMIITDPKGVIMLVNQAFTKLTGYSVEEAIGNTPHMLSSGRHDPEFYQHLWATLTDQGFWQGEIWNRRKNGQIYPQWLNISAVNEPSGNVSHYVACFSDITSNKDATAKIYNLAYFDPLTQLPNRRHLYERLTRALVISQRTKKHGALLFIDLDNFKTLNDTLGHDVGDMLLNQVARRLLGCMREGDTVTRQGGDEFVIILEELSCDNKEAAIQAKDVGDNILAALNLTYQLSHHQYHNTPSIGITLFCDDKGMMDDVLKRADIAMYAAKEAGRNRLRFFDPAMQTAVMERAALEKDLIRALDEHQLILYFQLQAGHDRRIIGAEVLLRWQHPERGLVSPLAFIPLAEETRLIVPIGLWVLETACAQIKAWENCPARQHLQLAVNVSAHQFHEQGFVEQVCITLAKHAIQPSRLKLELTESLVLDDIESAIAKMHELKKIGVQFSMDDFGTGFSSLAYLTQLPLNQLKIDQSFVRNIGVKPTDAVIVQTIIGMAKNLDMEVIAEGVETEEQRTFLERHGCPVIQGYLFGRPVPIEEFEALLNAG